jgi:hypothetical protein
MRADILRAVDRPSSTTEEQQHSAERNLIIHGRAMIHCEKVTLLILEKYRLLFKHVDQQQKKQRTSELLAIVTDALKLSRSLSHQYPYVGVFFLDDKDMRNQKFITNHKVFQAHRGMKLREDEEDEDGHDPREIGIWDRPLDFVIEPYIRRAGDEEAKNYESFKILHKAIVWMVSDADLEPNTKSRVKKEPKLRDLARNQPRKPKDDSPDIPTTPPLNPQPHLNFENARTGRDREPKTPRDRHGKAGLIDGADSDHQGHGASLKPTCTKDSVRQNLASTNWRQTTLSQQAQTPNENSSQEKRNPANIKSKDSQQESWNNVMQATDNRGKGPFPSATGQGKKRKRSGAEMSEASSGGDSN